MQLSGSAFAAAQGFSRMTAGLRRVMHIMFAVMEMVPMRGGGGFIYHVTSYGVTGERKELPPEISAQIELVRQATGLPVFAGFGFSTPDQAAAVRDSADGVIVGSLHHRLIQEKGTAATDDLRASTRGFVQALRPRS